MRVVPFLPTHTLLILIIEHLSTFRRENGEHRVSLGVSRTHVWEETVLGFVATKHCCICFNLMVFIPGLLGARGWNLLILCIISLSALHTIKADFLITTSPQCDVHCIGSTSLPVDWCFPGCVQHRNCIRHSGRALTGMYMCTLYLILLKLSVYMQIVLHTPMRSLNPHRRLDLLFSLAVGLEIGDPPQQDSQPIISLRCSGPPVSMVSSETARALYFRPPSSLEAGLRQTGRQRWSLLRVTPGQALLCVCVCGRFADAVSCYSACSIAFLPQK